MAAIIVIPTYNEALNIENLIREVFKRHAEVSILVVDDNSTDNTKNIVIKLQEEFKNNLFLLNRPSKMGLASAYTDGFKYAINLNKGFDKFIEMDADFSHDPKHLADMLNYLREYDVVIASRNIKGGRVDGWGIIRNLISKGGSLYSKIILNCPINDLTGGFNGWSLKAIESIGIDNIISKGYSFQIEMKYRAFKKGLSIKEFPIVFVDRKFGKSKMSKKIFFEALLNVMKIRNIK